MDAEVRVKQCTLLFDQGTLVLESSEPDIAQHASRGFVADPRIGGRLRAPAIHYRRALAQLIRAGFKVDDQARAYSPIELPEPRKRSPYPHQAEAMSAWRGGGKRGVIVLPTGAGKSYIAEMAIFEVQRSTLIVAPTIDLMMQWINLLSEVFGEEMVGGVGGGIYDVKALTATTYDSAYIHVEHLGNRFGLLVFDECHHLPGASYAGSAEGSIAPFRLGLSATPERPDGSHERLDHLIGPTLYRRDIKDLAGLYLADYEVVRVEVDLTAPERERYEHERALYRDFVSSEGIRVSSPGGWGHFIQASCRSERGRRAWRGWREQRRISLQSEAKLERLASILKEHAGEQIIIFTADNDTVYAISRRHLIPALTHQTPGIERKRVLAQFNAGELRAVVTSKVLNEGVDMPAASVGVVLSGSGSVREHVQRLGRILRRGEGKQAVLYEVITRGTGEEGLSERRRDHGAYQ